MSPTQVAFDIGGTFTDVTMIDHDGRVVTGKLLSLMDSIGRAIGGFVDSVIGDPGQVRFAHGTTVASNAIIEGKTARTGLITTEGFRDVLELRSQRGPASGRADWEPPVPLTPRHLRVGVRERLLADGTIDTALTSDAATAAVRQLVDAGVEAIAICLLHSYVDPSHEAMLEKIASELAPEISCCVSSLLDPEPGEYERTSTTVVNAALMPVMRRYTSTLLDQLERFRPQLHLMQSNGGLLPVELATERPALIIESGPAAGALAAARLATEAGLPKVISFDMGGTTAKACLIEDGVPMERPGGEVAVGATVASSLVRGSSGEGYAVRMPSIDLVEVGAGGGSIAWIDHAGGLRAGPVSASADPGPVCYGRGGVEPTVTDAHVVLGYMNPEAIAGATLRLDAEAARRAIARTIAAPLGMSVEDAAFGIVQVANATMMRALRAVSTERGRDPREHVIVAFGGAGPLHAADLAAALGASTVWVPLHAGVFSSIGLLLADLRVDHRHPINGRLANVDPDELVERATELSQLAGDELVARGADSATISITRWVDVRYEKQIAELPVALPTEVPAVELRRVVRDSFVAAHEREFGHRSDDEIEVVGIRVRAQAPTSSLTFGDLAAQAPAGAPVRSTRAAYFGPAAGWLDVPVLTRQWDVSGEGPMIVERPDTTLVVPPGWSAEADVRLGSIVLRRQ